MKKRCDICKRKLKTKRYGELTLDLLKRPDSVDKPGTENVVYQIKSIRLEICSSCYKKMANDIEALTGR